MTGDAPTIAAPRADAAIDPLGPPARRPGGERRWRNGLVDLIDVIRLAGRLLWRHWPVLVALGFAGMAARGLFTYVAVRISAHNSVAGLLVFILVPLATLVALTLMLRVLRESLPSLRHADGSPTRGRSLDAIGSVLIPFLAVYASYGYLQADKSSYYYDTWAADQLGSSRLPTRLTALLIAVVVIAAGARTLLDRWAWARDRGWIGIIRAYLEVVWIAVLASVLEPLREAAWTWLSDRRVTHGGVAQLDQWSQLGHPVHTALDWVGGLLDSAETIIAAPVAWLAVGAVVYGRELARTSGAGDRRLARAVSRRWVRLPKLVQRSATSIRSSFDDRFGPLVDGLRVIFRAGLVPMLGFCLLFLVAQSAGTWLFMLERSVIGPHPLATWWIPVSAPLSIVNDAITWMILICLLGAATDRAVRAPAGNAAEPHPPAQRSPESEPVAAATG